ncbi:MAG TPA: hypothetical protein VGD80_13060 [Kofleriaceae bacterium]
MEALIDTRMPREPKVSAACRQAVQAAREANPQLTVDEALEILRKQRITPLPSASTIKREFKRVKDRRHYARKKAAREGKIVTEVFELPLAGGELLAAAEIEAGGIAALTDEVMQIAEQAIEDSAGRTKAKRVLITPLKPSRVPSLELTYTRGSYYRACRENDELRIAEATLVHKASGRSLKVGALLMRRAHRDVDTVLLTTACARHGRPRAAATRPPRRWRPSRAQRSRSIAPAAPRSSSAPTGSPRADDISNHSA